MNDRFRVDRALLLLLIILLCMNPLYAFKAGTHAVLASEVARNLPEQSLVKQAMMRYPQIVAWGSTGPDLPANSVGIMIDHAPWFEKYHYEKVGTYARTMLEIALSQRNHQQIAWAAGWLTHVVGDLYCHGIFVNPDPEVGGVYLADPDTKEMHGFLEAYADKVMFTDKSDPKRTYNVQHMQETFSAFDATEISRLMQLSSREIYGAEPSQENIEDWMGFFKKIYLNTGIAGGTNWVYNNTYQEATDHLLEDVGIIHYGQWAGLTRKERLDLAYDEAVATSVSLLGDAERNNYHEFSDAWNLDAYHRDGRSIGTLTVTIRTADERFAGTDDGVYFGLVRDDGLQWRSPELKKGSGMLGLGDMIINDFERGSCETYYMFVESNEYPIDRISRVFLQKDSDEYAGGWKVDSLTVTINGIPYFDGAVDTWLEEDHLYWSAPVMSVPPQRIPVVIDITADVVGDTVSLHTYFVSSVHVPYSGPATLAVQHGDGTVTTYQLNIGSDGSLVRSLPLSPNDKLQAHIYRPKENNTQEIYTGGTPWIHPSIPYEQITINADAFNDTVSGTIGGSYHGPVEILVRDMEGAADDRVYRTSARSGEYSLSIPIVGSDGVGVWSFCEGVRLPRGEYLVAPDLNSLEFSTGISGHDGLDGTVVNSANDPVGSFIGDVYLGLPGSTEAVALTRTYESGGSQGSKVGKAVTSLPTATDSNTSEFSFRAVPIVLELGYSLWIEHEGLTKYFSYDPMEEVEQEARTPVRKAVVSPVSHVVDQVVNPMLHSISNQQGMVSQTQSSATMYMMAPQQSLWEGAWETSIGPMVITQSQEQIQGTYGEDGYSLNGKVSGNRLVGIVDEGDDLLGSLDLTLSGDGKFFTGTLRYAQEQWFERVDGTLVSPLERAGIVANGKNLEGVWCTDLGIMVLDSIVGGYRGYLGSEGHTLEGQFASGILRGRILSPHNDEFEPLKLSFDRSLTSFSGCYTSGDEDISWEGYRMR